MSDTIYNNEEFLIHLNALKPIGYTVNNEGFYHKDEANRKVSIFLQADKDFPFDVRFYGAGVQICVTQVEQIFHHVWQTFPNISFGHSLNAPTFVVGFREDIIGTSGYQFLLKNRVSDTASFNEAYPYLNQLMNAAINFVNQYTTLQSLYNYGGSLSDDDEVDFYNHPASSRMAIVMKLLNIPYATFLQNEITLYNQHNLTELANFNQALKNYLDIL